MATADPARKNAQTLRGVYTGRIQKARLLELYPNGAQFRCLLPGREADVVAAGPAAMLLAASLPIPATLVARDATPTAAGVLIEAEIRPAFDRVCRRSTTSTSSRLDPMV